MDKTSWGILASARHLDLGYVDFPPVTPLIARLVQVFAPDSLVDLQFTGVLAGALVVVLVASNFNFQTVTFDQLVWALLLWLVAPRAGRRRPAPLLLAGLVLGIGLETKYTVAGLAVVTSSIANAPKDRSNRLAPR